MTNKKLIVGLSLAIMLMIPIMANFAEAKSDKICVIEDQSGIILQTDYMTLKIPENNPHFIWWNGNQSFADEMYNLQISKIQEFFGDDDVLDDHMELNGVTYDLLNNEWIIEIFEGEDFATITLTLNGLANGVDIQIIMNVYSEDKLIPGTDIIIKALSEVKFDIIVNNWLFSEGAAGLAIRTKTLESQKQHQVEVKNGTTAENGDLTRLLQFESKEYGQRKVAFFGWTTFADIYNEYDIKIDTIEVGNAFLDMGGQGLGDASMIQMYLTYPNYGDSLKMIHDPSIGVYPDSFSVPLSILPIIGGLITTIAITVIIKRRK